MIETIMIDDAELTIVKINKILSCRYVNSNMFENIITGIQFGKVKTEISVFEENLHKSFGFPIC